jgi:hypothetical protein
MLGLSSPTPPAAFQSKALLIPCLNLHQSDASQAVPNGEDLLGLWAKGLTSSFTRPGVEKSPWQKMMRAGDDERPLTT